MTFRTILSLFEVIRTFVVILFLIVVVLYIFLNPLLICVIVMLFHFKTSFFKYTQIQHKLQQQQLNIENWQATSVKESNMAAF